MIIEYMIDMWQQCGMDMIRSPYLIIVLLGDLFHEEGWSDAALRIDVELNFQQIFLQSPRQVQNQLDDEILIVFLQVFVGYQ